MRYLRLKSVIPLLAVLMLFSCSDELPKEGIHPKFEQEVAVSFDDETFVSSEQAVVIAEVLLSRETGAKTKALAGASVETVRNNNNPAMHVVNYPEGGFVIVSATKDYYPVLAYSDENSFDLENVSEMGASVWLEETKEAIRVSESLDVETKAQIGLQWQVYETNEIKSPSNTITKSDQTMQERIEELMLLYGLDGWQIYMSLEEANGWLDNGTYQTLVSQANYFGSPIQSTIVAIKQTMVTTYQKGPLLTTKWGQWYPYNAWCPPGPRGSRNNYPVGCTAVAMGQIMKYHQRPLPTFTPIDHPYASEFSPTPGWSFVFNWSNMPDGAPSSYHSTAALLYAIGRAIDTEYTTDTSTAGTSIVGTAFKNIYGYTTVIKDDHNADTVKAALIANRPVFMRGTDSWNGGGHAWVCDGLKEERIKTEYFVEFYTGSSYDTYGYYTPANPGSIIMGSTFTYHNMNWGWGGQSNGWFYENNVNPSGENYRFNFQFDRTNIYATP